jgi:hypothetical protein
MCTVGHTTQGCPWFPLPTDNHLLRRSGDSPTAVRRRVHIQGTEDDQESSFNILATIAGDSPARKDGARYSSEARSRFNV